MILYIILIVAAFAILIPLAWYAYSLTQQVKAQQLAQEQAEQKQQEVRNKKREYVIESIQVISRNVIEEDLNISEAAIRLTALLSNLQLDQARLDSYRCLSDLFEKVKGFATHEDRKFLEKRELKRQDKEREGFEREHREFILVACQALISDEFDGIEVIL